MVRLLLTRLAAAAVAAASIAVGAKAGPVGNQVVNSTILVLARDAFGAQEPARIMNGYGIPYQILLVPQAGLASLPALNSSATHGNYGGIVMVSELSYNYNNLWQNALTTAQLGQLFDYQVRFAVRMVRLDAYPNVNDFGAVTAIAGAGCCNTGVEQLISYSNTTGFATARLNAGAGVSTAGLWHYPATVVNTTNTWEFARFAPSGAFLTNTTAAVINNIAGREQMAFFIGWGSDWSATTNYLQHSWVHWMTRGLFVGKRITYLSCQIDDVGLTTDLYFPNNTAFRLRTGDLAAHVTWQTSLNKRLPAGSAFRLELGHNGNGDLIAVTDAGNDDVCKPEPFDGAVDYDSPPDTPLEYAKPLGTGTDLWPEKWTKYDWPKACALRDNFTNWFTTAANLNSFMHVSHTFSHEELNNATYHDAEREIQFNQAWMAQIGISNATRFSAKGIIPPAITGLHNGDVIRAWADNGIRHVVGDNTRPALRNTKSEFWPLISTVADNGYAGLVIMPRWATTIYYNCDLPACTLNEWITTSAGHGDFTTLLDDARATNVRYLLSMHPDPYMFHQANMRQTDVAPLQIGNQSGKLSLVMAWTETVTQEMVRLTSWPLISMGHDDLAQVFVNRMTLDNCFPNLSYNYDATGTKIASVTVGTAFGNKCGVPVPVTVPGTATASGGTATAQKIGADPSIMWVNMTGSAVTLKLSAAVAAL